MGECDDPRAGRSRAARAGQACDYCSIFAGTGAAPLSDMTSKILVLLLLSASLARAEDRGPPPGDRPDDLTMAVARERDAATRERYNAQLTTIAERDIVTAQITRDMALRQWDAAARAHRTDDVERWSKRHASALRDERAAQDRAFRHARERDEARADFDASAERVRRLERQASRSHRA
jgi:hypothetical protein